MQPVIRASRLLAAFGSCYSSSGGFLRPRIGGYGAGITGSLLI